MNAEKRVGIFICHCGTNIAGTVDVAALKDHYSKKGHVVVDHLFLCSQAGQEAIRKAIKENGLDRAVIASCSPKHHGNIFKECVGKELNPYMWDMANIREQCAWTTDDKELATKKAKAIIAGSVARVMLHDPIDVASVPVVRKVAVIGGGIAGLHASLELAEKDLEVFLIEKEPILGGNMVRLDRTFPTDDCAMCTISPILNQVMAEPRIHVLTMSEVKEVDGRPGDYLLTIHQRPRYVDHEKCTGCSACARSNVPLDSGLMVHEGLVDRISIDPAKCKACGACAKKCKYGAIVQPEKGAKPSYNTNNCVGCWECLEACKFDSLKLVNVCPVVVPSEFDLGLGYRKAIYIPNAQGVPLKYLRDPGRCLRLTDRMDCMGCTKACSADAIKDEDEEVEEQINVGAIIVATGYKQLDLVGTEYRLEHPNVITGLELERLLSPAGPTHGELLRPSDSKPPKSVVFVQCAGSRDRRRKEYCSKVCCMYATKNARLIKREAPETDVRVCYTDLRAAGRGYEEYFDQARDLGIEFVRGNVGEVVPIGDRLLVKMENTFLGEPEDIEADLVVLSVAMEPSEGTSEMERLIPLVPGKDGFIAPLHVKIAPVDTMSAGIFVCGTAEAPKPIQECITDAGAAASRAASFLKNEEMRVDLVTAFIDPKRCISCGRCEEWCDYDAIESDDTGYRVLEVSCRACGRCAANCPANAIDLRLNSDLQLEANATGILGDDKDSIIVYACEQCGYNAADLAGTAKRRYSTEVKVIKVPCSGRVSAAQMILPFEKGAKGVMVAACLDGQCHFIDGNTDSKRRSQEVRRALDVMGVGSARLQFSNISSSEGDKFVQAVEKILEAVREDER
jgi:heterodisulfide reductase subunit A-like polyferredoxin/coenzyme F420-reducing hydrogenase delta subunit